MARKAGEKLKEVEETIQLPAHLALTRGAMRMLTARHTLRNAATVAGILLNSCALNPVTGKSELALVSESQEIDKGKQSAADVGVPVHHEGRFVRGFFRYHLTQIARNAPWGQQRPG